VASIRLIAGLGNPGPRYHDTRHNVGERWVRELAARFDIRLADERRFHGEMGRGTILGHDVRLLVPLTFMNLSGDSVGAAMRFFRVEPAELLVVYDEVAFAPGIVRLKAGGGANGHNGVKHIIETLSGERDFQRLRIGVGHPGDPQRMSAFLTGVTMPASERTLVEDATTLADGPLGDLLAGNAQAFMNAVHGAPQGE
jgi:PTH1 family peptidyl-tRNA hydrolase